MSHSTLLRTDSLVDSACFWHDQPDGSVVIENVQNVEEIVALAKAEYNSTDERARWTHFQVRVARLPLTILLDLYRRGIIDDQPAFKRWLNDPDHRFFRTRPGRV